MSNHSKKLSRAAGFLAIAAAIIFILALVMPTRAQSQSRSTIPTAPTLEYEIVSVKLNKTGIGSSRPVMNNTPDGYIATNVPLMLFIQGAYGIFDTDRIIGAPSWLNSERYDVEAKMSSTAAAELARLTPDQRTIARQQMFQALLADRFKLTIHRDTKELTAYSLVIAKDGPKLQEAKPGDTYANGFRDPNGGRGGAGTIQMNGRGVLICQGVPVTQFAGMLSWLMGHNVVDRTALTGKYDFTLKWTPEENEGPSIPAGLATANGQPAPPAPDPNGPSLFTALQDQLGLKLESKKGPAEVIIIDHVERPSGN
jgi:uncharacterized protein (TIGR03435 family)